MAGKFVLKTSSDGQFRFVLKAGNGETILSSELYKTKAAALNGIESVKKNASIDERYERKVDKAGHPRFNLKAGNHEIIGSSEGYNSESARDHGIESVKANAPSAEVVDETGQH
ncbi:MAG TPA: YegP family protein [Terracidiphilus sp.]|nr:YegP family protein [Terracidiphilus sp.]